MSLRNDAQRSQAFAPDCDFDNAESKAGGRNFWVCLAQKPLLTAVSLLMIDKN
jgi:hypothetical protein